MSNLHVNLDEANKHTPKGFDNAVNNTRPWKDEQAQSTYTENFQLPRAINFVDGTVAPPTTADLDVYVLTGAGSVDAGWGTATFGDWVRFLNGIAAPITPLAGALCYDDTAASWKEFDGSVWAVFGGSGGANLSEGTTTNTTVDVDSDSGTNATLLAASTSRAGVQTKANFDAVTANTAKVSNATHTSEVTGATALTVNKIAISNKTLVTADGADHVLIGDASDSDNLKKVLVSDFLGGGNTIYTADGTLTGARTVNMSTNPLTFDGSAVGGGSLIFQGGLNTNKGLYLFGSTGTVGANYKAALVNIGGGTSAQLVLRTASGDSVVNTGAISYFNGGVNSLGVLNSTPSTAAYNFNVKQPNGGNGLRVYTANGQNEFHLHDNGGGSAVVRFLSSGICYFNTAGSVGVGLTAPTAKLHVKGAGSTSGTSNFKTTNAIGQPVIEARDDNAIGFYGVTPVVQATTLITPLAFVANTSGIADDSATFGGYTIGEITAALQAIGILQ